MAQSLTLFDLSVGLSSRRLQVAQLHMQHACYKEMLQGLQQTKQELHSVIKEPDDSRLNVLMKELDIKRDTVKAEEGRKAVLQKEAQREVLKEERDKLMEEQLHLHRRAEMYSLCNEFFEEVVKITQWEAAQVVSDRLRSLFHIRQQLFDQNNEVIFQATLRTKALQTCKDQHRLQLMHSMTQLSQLHAKHEEARAETLIWERKNSEIQETAAKKTLLLGHIKLGTLNLYDTTSAVTGEIYSVTYDTEAELKQIKTFIQDNNDIVKKEQAKVRREQKKEPTT